MTRPADNPETEARARDLDKIKAAEVAQMLAEVAAQEEAHTDDVKPKWRNRSATTAPGMDDQPLGGITS